MVVKFKRLHTDAILPKYVHDSDAGMDIYLHTTHSPLVPGEIRIIPVGFSVEIPEGYELQIRSRSGLSSRGIFVINSPATIDSGYRGEIGVILCNISQAIQPLNRGDRVAQLILNEVPKIEWEIVDEIDCSDRGVCGFGSSGI